MLNVTAVILSAALIAAMVLNLTLKPRLSARLSTVCLALGVLGGLVFYGTGWMETTQNLPIAVTRTTLSVFRMFVGVNELGAISGATLVSTKTGVVIFWLIHLLAFYSIASAAMQTIGAALVRQMRFWRSLRGDLVLIYGIDEDSIELGKACVEEKAGSVVFVAENVPVQKINDLNNMGMSVMTGRAAVKSQKPFIRTLRLNKRAVTVYALDEDRDRNLIYAQDLVAALEKEGVTPEKTGLTLRGEEENLTALLQASETHYGFGYVHVFDPAQLTARAMIRTVAPWTLLSFNDVGKAQEDFDCVILGFGDHGQAALSYLVRNAQFEGSRFHAMIFSPNFDAEAGGILTDCPYLFEAYDIEHISSAAMSRAFFEYLDAHLDKIKLIAVCTGDPARDDEITQRLMLHLKRWGREEICVVQCGDQGVRYQATVGSPVIFEKTMSLPYLDPKRLDAQAILINAGYDHGKGSSWEKWMHCDVFSKMSSRASADFAPAFAAMSSKTPEQILRDGWDPDGDLLENLARTEHLRWCAFHATMGYRPMQEDEMRQRARKIARDGSGRVGKDATARLHSCLVSWDKLADIARLEEELTGKSADYRQMDRNNVLSLPELLRAEEKWK